VLIRGAYRGLGCLGTASGPIKADDLFVTRHHQTD
jgi:hypothetical protein